MTEQEAIFRVDLIYFVINLKEGRTKYETDLGPVVLGLRVTPQTPKPLNPFITPKL